MLLSDQKWLFQNELGWPRRNNATLGALSSVRTLHSIVLLRGADIPLRCIA